MKNIPLTQGKVALVDDADFEELNQHKWYTSYEYKMWYARRNITLSNGKKTTIKMHRQIMGFPERKDIDHKNHDGLDNRRCNLRICTHSQNMKNHHRHKHNTSGLNGVCWSKYHKKWKARIYEDDKQIFLGYFDRKEDAGRAVDENSVEIFGEFAVLNFPEEKGVE